MNVKNSPFTGLNSTHAPFLCMCVNVVSVRVCRGECKYYILLTLWINFRNKFEKGD